MAARFPIEFKFTLQRPPLTPHYVLDKTLLVVDAADQLAVGWVEIERAANLELHVDLIFFRMLDGECARYLRCTSRSEVSPLAPPSERKSRPVAVRSRMIRDTFGTARSTIASAAARYFSR